MITWAGLALALRRPDEDAMRSRVPTYIHPLAGRALAWHSLRALSVLDPPPRQLFLVSASPLDPSVVQDLPAEIVETSAEDWWPAVAERLDEAVDRLLVVDAAAATLDATLRELPSDPGGRAVAGKTGTMAVWLDRAAAERAAAGGASLDELAAGLAVRPPATPAEDCIVRDRIALAAAGVTIRDRLVASLMAEGASFLLPETVLVDVDVRIGPDTVVYPNVTLEGQTTIGAETVVGPGCRIIDSWIGSGVELKGWNYIIGASIRNRAVLEPYVRRGFA